MRIPEPQGFSRETEREFDEICDAVAELFASVARDGADFEIHEQSTSGCSIDFIIINYVAIKPADVESRFADIQRILQRYHQFWCVRFWLYKPTQDLLQPDQCIWLEVTKYGVAPYRGKKEVEIFDEMRDLYLHYWGTDFSAG